MSFRYRVQLEVLSRHIASTGIVQDAASLYGPRRSYPGGNPTTLQIHWLFATEAVYPVTGVSDQYLGEFVP